MLKKSTFGKYLSLIKFSHTIFALPFAIIGFFLGVQYFHYSFELVKLIYVLLCMVFARSAAMAFNRYIDRNIDKNNPRTVIREIPAGKLKAQSVLIFTILNCILFITSTYFINSICLYLSPIALAVVLFYSYTKRFTPLCHLVLGAGLALAPIGAFLAVTGVFNILPLLFSFTVLFWVSGFDIIYALQDEDFDKSQNLKSIPVLLGTKNALLLSRILHSLSQLSLIIVGFYAHFDWFYWIGTAVFGSLLIYQHSLVKHNDLSKINLAFFTTNGIASVVFSVFVLLELFV